MVRLGLIWYSSYASEFLHQVGTLPLLPPLPPRSQGVRTHGAERLAPGEYHAAGTARFDQP